MEQDDIDKRLTASVESLSQGLVDQQRRHLADMAAAKVAMEAKDARNRFLEDELAEKDRKLDRWAKAYGELEAKHEQLERTHDMVRVERDVQTERANRAEAGLQIAARTLCGVGEDLAEGRMPRPFKRLDLTEEQDNQLQAAVALSIMPTAARSIEATDAETDAELRSNGLGEAARAQLQWRGGPRSSFQLPED